MAVETLPEITKTQSREGFRWPIAVGRYADILVVIASLPLAALHGFYLSSTEQYQFAPLLLVAVAWLLWKRWPTERLAHGFWSRMSGLAFLSCGLLCLVAATIVFSSWLGMLAAIFLVAWWLWRRAGAAFWAELLPIWCLLWLLAPPLGVEQQLVAWLQTFTTQCSSAVLDAFGILHLRGGNVIRLPDHSLLVEEACSGINSLITLVACVAVFAVWARRPLLHAVLLVVSAVFWAGLGNLVRVVTMTVALANWNLDLSSGWPHQLLGMAVFGLALLGVASTDQILASVLSVVRWTWVFPWRKRSAGRRSRRRQNAGGPNRGAPATRFETLGLPAKLAAGQRQRPTWVLAGFCGLLGGLQLVGVVMPLFASRELSFITANCRLDRSSFPEQQGGWELVRFESTQRPDSSDLGEFSNIWLYQNRTRLASLSFDYPFVGWHELPICYQARGWNVARRQVISDRSDPQATSNHVVEVSLSKPTGESGHLLFCILDGRGRSLAPPPSLTHYLERLRMKATSSPVLRAARGDSLTGDYLNPSNYQFQLFLESDRQLSVTESQELRNSFVDLVRRLQRQWDQVTGKAT
jgi:exosortase